MDEQLLGLAEIADLYGIDKSTANNWSRQRDFPEPRWRLKMGPIWTFGQIEHWRIPARTVKDDFPPAPIVFIEKSGFDDDVFAVQVQCPLCPKKHGHNVSTIADLGPRTPHCSIPRFDASYNLTDPHGLIAKAQEKWSRK